MTFRLAWGDSPMADQAPAEWRDKILHATLQVGGMAFSGGDVLPGGTNAHRVFKFSSTSTMSRQQNASSRSSQRVGR